MQQVSQPVAEAQSRALVASFEKFIDENIRSALRQHAPEHAPYFWDMNDLWNAREALVKALMPVIAK